MNRSLNLIALLTLAVAGHAALADDTMTRSSMTKHQAMKECIEQQKTANVNMSQGEMKRICKDRLKQQKATGDMPEKPAADAPRG